MPRRHYSPEQIVTKLRQAEIDLATSPATITSPNVTIPRDPCADFDRSSPYGTARKRRSAAPRPVTRTGAGQPQTGLCFAGQNRLRLQQFLSH